MDVFRQRVSLCAAVFVSTFVMRAVEPAVSSNDLARIPPVEATNALKTFQIKAGFRIEQVAAEPLVEDPIAMAFDENNRLFVVEMRDYPEGRDANPHSGRIRLLEDTDGDGVFDKSTIYAENLSWPSAVVCYGGGIFVAATPDIIYLKDTDGDGKADTREIVFSGFGSTATKLNVQALVNSFTWGLDNRIHGVTAGNGGEIVPLKSQPVQPLLLRGRDFSFDPRSLVMSAESGTAQYGMSFDNRGRKFVCDNSHHAKMVMYELRYAARNPFYAMPPAVIDIAPPAAPIYRISPDEAWRVIRTRWRTTGVLPSGGIQDGGGRVSGYFSAASSITIYRGSAFGQEFQENSFVADCGANLVHRDKLRPVDWELVAERPPDEQKTEFLAAKDNWFRPVALANAPDGTLYVADMYREIIEHPWALPDAIKKHLDLNSGNDRGRIYRIVPVNFKQPKLGQLGKLTSPQLVTMLSSPNGWHRDTVARLVYERQDKSAVPALTQFLNQSPSPLGRLHALHVLDGLGALTEAHVLRGLRDGDDRVREHAVLLSEKLIRPDRTVSDSLWTQLRALTSDASAPVRYQLAFTLGEIFSRGKVPALAEIIRRDVDNRWMRAAVLSSLADGAGEMLASVTNNARLLNSASGQDFLRQLVLMIGTKRQPDEVAQVFNYADTIADPRRLYSLLNTLGEGLARGKSSLAAMDTKGIANTVFADAVLVVSDTNVIDSLRIEAIKLLGFSRYADAGPALLSLLNPAESPAAQTAAIKALNHLTDPQVGSGLVQRWPMLTPRVRSEALTVLLSRPERIAALLDGIESGRVLRVELNANQIKFLLTHPDARVAQQAKKLFGEPAAAPRQEVIDRFMPALQLTGAPARGRETFLARCASCHQLAGEGHAVGPDLASVRSSGKEKILVNILDPNREAAPNYLSYVVTTRDGESLMGLVVNETAASIIVRQANGIENVVFATNVQSIQTQGLSLMPEALEAGLTPQDFADLLEYIMTAQPQRR